MHQRSLPKTSSVAGIAGTFGFAVVCGFAAPASAVPVVNPSFESPVVPAGGSSPVITGWVNGNPGGGVYGPSPSNFTAPNGLQVAFTGPGNGAIIYQDTGVAVIPGDTYQLSAFVGQLANIGSNLPLYDYRVFLGFGGHDLATTTLFATFSATNGGVAGPILSNSFALITASGIAPASASSDLLILLGGGNADAFGVSGQALFDQVSLTDVSAVPEPATALILGSGLIGLAGLFSRKRQAA